MTDEPTDTGQPEASEEPPVALPSPLTQAMDHAVDVLEHRVAPAPTDDQAQTRQAALDYAQAHGWDPSDRIHHLDPHEEGVVRTTLGKPGSTDPITLYEWLYAEARKAVQDQRARTEAWSAEGFGSINGRMSGAGQDPDFDAWYLRQRGPQQASFGRRTPVRFDVPHSDAQMDTMLRDMADEVRANRPLVVRGRGG